MNTSVDNINDDEIRTIKDGEYTNEQLSLLTTLDAKATGLKRKERIELLAKEIMQSNSDPVLQLHLLAMIQLV